MPHLKPRSITVTLYQGDDMDTLATLNRRVLVAKHIAEQAEGNARAGDDNESLAAAEAAYDAFVDEAAERALAVELQSIGLEFFSELMALYPPRMVDSEPDADGKVTRVVHEDDKGWDVDTTQFPMALLTFRRRDEDGDEPEVIATIARPEFSTDAKVKRFVNRELAEGDFISLWQAAYWQNRSPSLDPKALRHSMSDSLSTDET